MKLKRVAATAAMTAKKVPAKTAVRMSGSMFDLPSASEAWPLSVGLGLA